MQANIQKFGSLDCIEILPMNEGPTSLVVMMHGYGADHRDLADICAMWSNDLPQTVFILPNAPFPCEMSPMGRQWFSLSEYTIPAMEREIVKAQALLDSCLDDALSYYDLPDNHMVLSGFSQGCMMSLYNGLRRPKSCAGILGYSGRLLSGAPVTTPAHKTIPIHLIHGEADEIVPVESWDHATQALTAAGFSATGYTTPGLPHGIDPRGIESGLTFIKNQCLPEAT